MVVRGREGREEVEEEGEGGEEEEDLTEALKSKLSLPFLSSSPPSFPSQDFEKSKKWGRGGGGEWKGE